MFRGYKYRYRPTPKAPTYHYKMSGSKRHKTHKYQGLLALCIIIATFIAIYIQLDREVMPTVVAMAQHEATTISTKAINESVSLAFIV